MSVIGTVLCENCKHHTGEKCPFMRTYALEGQRVGICDEYESSRPKSDLALWIAFGLGILPAIIAIALMMFYRAF